MLRNSVAIFDVDGVVIKGQSLFILVQYLLRKKKVSFLYFINVSIWFLFYKLGLTKNVVLIRKKALKIIKGWRVDDVGLMLEDFYKNDLKNYLNKKIIEILNSHISQGHIVVLASASIKPLISLIAKDLGIRNYVSSDVESIGDYYTGNTGVLAYGKEKLYLVKDLLDKLNVNLEDVYVYSDDLSDYSLLSFAKYAHVINPNRQLKKVALKQNWQINDF